MIRHERACGQEPNNGPVSRTSRSKLLSVPERGIAIRLRFRIAETSYRALLPFSWSVNEQLQDDVPESGDAGRREAGQGTQPFVHQQD